MACLRSYVARSNFATPEAGRLVAEMHSVLREHESYVPPRLEFFHAIALGMGMCGGESAL